MHFNQSKHKLHSLQQPKLPGLKRIKTCHILLTILLKKKFFFFFFLTISSLINILAVIEIPTQIANFNNFSLGAIFFNLTLNVFHTHLYVKLKPLSQKSSQSGSKKGLNLQFSSPKSSLYLIYERLHPKRGTI